MLEDAAQAAGARARRTSGPARSATSATFSFYPSKNLGALRRRRRDRHRRRRSRRAGADAALPRLARQASPSSTSATTRAWTSSRPRSCGCCCPSSTPGRRGAARRRAPTPSAGLGEYGGLPVGPGARSTRRGISTWSRTPQADALLTALRRAWHSGARLLPHADPPSARDGRLPRRRRPELPVTDELARTNIALPMSPVLSRAPGREVVVARWPPPPGREGLGRPHQLAACARAGGPSSTSSARAGTRSRSRRVTSPRRSVCATASGSRTRRSATTAAAASRPRRWGLADRSVALARWARRASVRPRARPRLQRHHRGGGAAPDPVHDDVRLRVGDGPAQRQLSPRPGRRGARRDPAGAAVALRRAWQDPHVPGPQGGVLPVATSSPITRILASSASTRPSRSRWSAPRPSSRSITGSRTTSSAGCSTACAGTQTVVFPRTARAARRARPRRAASSCRTAAIDAQSLIAYADLVVSAGGTMNREAVALGTPVFTVFEGRLGAVDEGLIADGRLRRCAAPSRWCWSNGPPGAGGERVRRDPALLTESAAAPAGGI